MSVERMQMYNLICDVCGAENGPLHCPHAWLDEWEKEMFNGHKLDFCPAHRYGLTDTERILLAEKFPKL